MREVFAGREVGTGRRPNTPHGFHFWTAVRSAPGIGVLVRMDVGGPKPYRGYGGVVDGGSYTDLEVPLHACIGLEVDPAMAAPAATERPEFRLYTAAMLRHDLPEPLQPVSAGPVRLATAEDVRVALRMVWVSPAAASQRPRRSSGCCLGRTGDVTTGSRPRATTGGPRPPAGGVMRRDTVELRCCCMGDSNDG